MNHLDKHNGSLTNSLEALNPEFSHSALISYLNKHNGSLIDALNSLCPEFSYSAFETQIAIPDPENPDIPFSKHYLVVGRAHGDDEASVRTYICSSEEEAIACFTVDFKPADDTLALIRTNISEPDFSGVYIDAVYSSNSPIT